MGMAGPISTADFTIPENPTSKKRLAALVGEVTEQKQQSANAKSLRVQASRRSRVPISLLSQRLSQCALLELSAPISELDIRGRYLRIVFLGESTSIAVGNEISLR